MPTRRIKRGWLSLLLLLISALFALPATSAHSAAPQAQLNDETSALLPVTGADRNFAVNLSATNPTSGLGIVLGSLSNKLFLDLELTAADERGLEDCLQSENIRSEQHASDHTQRPDNSGSSSQE